MTRIPQSRATRNRNRRPQQNQDGQVQSFHRLPFARSFFDFVRQNQGKQLSLIFGIGTSGSRNLKKAAEFVEKQLDLYQNKAFFLLMVDTEYENEEQRRISSEPLLDMDYEMMGTEQLVNEEGTRVYLWGATLPTSYNPMEKYSELRDNIEGTYHYGQQCTLTQETEAFYRPLLAFFRVPILQSIYIYNQGYYNTRHIEYILLRDRYYQGPSFHNVLRIVRQSENEMRRRSRYNISPMLTVGQYFENFCELLYCLFRSDKPVFLLKEEEGTLRSSVLSSNENMTGGTKKRKTRKFQKSRRQTR
jgi:hypothetical protein